MKCEIFNEHAQVHVKIKGNNTGILVKKKKEMLHDSYSALNGNAVCMVHCNRSILMVREDHSCSHTQNCFKKLPMFPNVLTWHPNTKIYLYTLTDIQRFYCVYRHIATATRKHLSSLKIYKPIFLWLFKGKKEQG